MNCKPTKRVTKKRDRNGFWIQRNGGTRGPVETKARQKTTLPSLYIEPKENIQEVKDFDVYISSLTTTSDVLGGQNYVAIGTAPNQRVGRKIEIIKLMVNVSIQYKPVGMVDYGKATGTRFMIVLDTQCNGALPLIGDILSAVNTQGWLAPYERANQYRFKILYDDYFTNNVHSIYSTTQMAPVTTKVPFIELDCKIPIQWKGTTTGIGDLASNNILYVILSEETIAAKAVMIQGRILFTDN